MTKLLDVQPTIEILDRFYADCLTFWEREKLNNQSNYDENIDPKANAIKEVESISNNPFNPNGEELCSNAKNQWLKAIK